MKRLLPIFLMALLVGACGSATPSESPSTTPSESPVAEVTPTPTPTPTPDPAAPAGLFAGATSPIELTPFDLTTPIYLDSWWSEVCEISCIGNDSNLPEIASDGTLLYFIGSTGTPVTDENAADYNGELPPTNSYRLFVYDPADGSARSAKVGEAPFGLGTPIIPAADSSSLPTFLAGACLSDVGESTEAFSSGIYGGGFGEEGEAIDWPFTTVAYFNGTSGTLGVSCQHYGSPDLNYLASDETSSPYADGGRLCFGVWQCDRDQSAALYPAAWTDLYAEGHPAPVCPPGAPKCKLGKRLTESSSYSGKALTGKAYGPVALYPGDVQPKLAFYATQPFYDGPDELRYYDQNTGTTGSVLLDGEPLVAMTNALLVGGKVYMGVRYWRFDDGEVYPSGFSALVRIDPANPGVATAITVAP